MTHAIKSTKILGVSIICAMTLTACGQSFEGMSEAASEQELNAPIGDDPTELGDPVPSKQLYTFPTFSAASGIAVSTWNKAEAYYNQNFASLGNTRYVTMINLGLASNKKRFFILDLETGTIAKHNTSHGVGSDPNNDGIATLFSNVANSKKSSLGIYITGETYIGKHGRSLKLHGMEATNSNAFARYIVVHGADYVNEAASTSGRSWGCPALDNSIAQPIITKIKNGSLLVIDRI